LALPAFSRSDARHRAIARLALRLTEKQDEPKAGEWSKLDMAARAILDLP
jgi:hypothetical protein